MSKEQFVYVVTTYEFDAHGWFYGSGIKAFDDYKEALLFARDIWKEEVTERAEQGFMEEGDVSLDEIETVNLDSCDVDYMSYNAHLLTGPHAEMPDFLEAGDVYIRVEQILYAGEKLKHD